MTPLEKKCQDLSDVCELAHNRTVRECKRRNIRLWCYKSIMDVRCEKHDEDYSHYTTKAQPIFDRHYAHIEEVTGL